MVKNQILENRICQLIAQTFAVPLKTVMEQIQRVGIEKTIEELENQVKITFEG